MIGFKHYHHESHFLWATGFKEHPELRLRQQKDLKIITSFIPGLSLAEIFRELDIIHRSKTKS